LVPIPPKLLQEQFAKILQSIKSQIALTEEAEYKTKILFHSLLAQAFSGELTAVWRKRHGAEIEEALRQREHTLKLENPPLLTIDTSENEPEITGSNEDLAQIGQSLVQSSDRGSFQLNLSDYVKDLPAMVISPDLSNALESLQSFKDTPLFKDIDTNSVAKLAGGAWPSAETLKSISTFSASAEALKSISTFSASAEALKSISMFSANAEVLKSINTLSASAEALKSISTFSASAEALKSINTLSANAEALKSINTLSASAEALKSINTLSASAEALKSINTLSANAEALKSINTLSANAEALKSISTFSVSAEVLKSLDTLSASSKVLESFNALSPVAGIANSINETLADSRQKFLMPPTGIVASQDQLTGIANSINEALADSRQKILMSPTGIVASQDLLKDSFQTIVESIEKRISRKRYKDHPRYELIQELSIEQYFVWESAIQTHTYFTEESLSKSAEIPVVITRRALPILAAAGLIQQVSLQDTSSQVLVYIEAYRARVEEQDDCRSADLAALRDTEEEGAKKETELA